MIPWRNLENFLGAKENQYQPQIPPSRSHGRPSSMGLLGGKGQILRPRHQTCGLGNDQKGSLWPNYHHAEMDNKVYNWVLCNGLPYGADQAMTNGGLPLLWPPQ